MLYGALTDYRAAEVNTAAGVMFPVQNVLPAGEIEIGDKQVAMAAKLTSVDLLEPISRMRMKQNGVWTALAALAGLPCWLGWLGTLGSPLWRHRRCPT